ncbi:hypothetical protein GCM10009530_64430 [Microbispora corallina]|uniref:Uncharacterized protein n=1 Tax=Microbispora corallina TaxID=83302 RepID=A0ABQ4G3C7_9ACTN|nr:hypothetical protein [Microbispora corallina]GIH41581.1 hypothetical protein Mco01_45810 [Microbispora corallina]
MNEIEREPAGQDDEGAVRGESDAVSRRSGAGGGTAGGGGHLPRTPQPDDGLVGGPGDVETPAPETPEPAGGPAKGATALPGLLGGPSDVETPDDESGMPEPEPGVGPTS